MTETQEMANFVVNTDLSDIPKSSQRKAKEVISDFIGASFLGSRKDGSTIVSQYVEGAYSGSQGTIINGGRTSPSGSALANGTFGHASKIDDTFESLIIHPTTAVFPAALSATECRENTGRSLLEAFIIGVEVAYRVGRSVYPYHYAAGWHATGTIGVFGAAAAAARSLELSSEQTLHAMGIAGSSSSSLRKNCSFMTKSLHGGHAAEMGLRAALLAEAGFDADNSIFEGTYGYCSVMTEDSKHDMSQLLDELGASWAVNDIGFKPYPTARITHAPMESLLTFLDEKSIERDSIELITVFVRPEFEDILRKKPTLTETNVTASMRYCVGVILQAGDVQLRQFVDEHIRHEFNTAYLDKVDVRFDNEQTRELSKFGARLKIDTDYGETFWITNNNPLGSPENPMTAEDRYQKFEACVADSLPPEDVSALYDLLDRLEEVDQLNQMTSLLRTKETPDQD